MRHKRGHHTRDHKYTLGNGGKCRSMHCAHDGPPRPDWVGRVSPAHRPASSPPGADGPRGGTPRTRVSAERDTTAPRSTTADDYYHKVLSSLISAYDCVQRSPKRAGAGHRAGIQNLPAGRPHTAHRSPRVLSCWTICWTVSWRRSLGSDVSVERKSLAHGRIRYRFLPPETRPANGPAGGREASPIGAGR